MKWIQSALNSWPQSEWTNFMVFQQSLSACCCFFFWGKNWAFVVRLRRQILRVWDLMRIGATLIISVLTRPRTVPAYSTDVSRSLQASDSSPVEKAPLGLAQHKPLSNWWGSGTWIDSMCFIMIKCWARSPSVTGHRLSHTPPGAVNHLNNTLHPSHTQWIHMHGQSAVNLSALVSAVVMLMTLPPCVFSFGWEWMLWQANQELTDLHRCANDALIL